jgi:hypothetical protein
MTTEKDPFLEMAKGRMPLPTVMGSAPSVVGEGQLPRPDRSYTKLKWLSTLGGIFGLDHFYLRNPYSGLLKGLTFGGFFVWWLWDAFQLWTEKDRVLLYGMSAPFDLKMGFGQGTIAEGKTLYEQRSDSAWWMLAAMFSFIGGDSMLLGNWGQMLRKLTEAALLAMVLIPLLLAWNESGVWGVFTVGNIIRALLAVLIGFIVVSEWFNVAESSLINPQKLMTDGIRVSPKQDQILNIPRAWVENIDMLSPEIKARIMHDIGYTSVSATEMKRSFEVRYVTDKDRAAEAAAEDREAAAKKAAEVGGVRWYWPLSYLVFVVGPIIIGIQFIVNAIKTAFYAIFPEAEAEAIAKKRLLKAANAAMEGKGLSGALASAVGPGLASAVGPGLASAVGRMIPQAHIDMISKLPFNDRLRAGEALESGIPIEQIVPPHIFNSVMAAKKAVTDAAAPVSDAIKTVARAGDFVKHALGATAVATNSNENPQPLQRGGARHEEPTSQGMILGASVFALAGGAAIKLAVDYLLPQ